ncbi:MAG: hypothetical protein V2I32_09220, partial [Desulforhopalus sp.]|nr:hypothetical protein [Desulforhopalus sp.]
FLAEGGDRLFEYDFHRVNSFDCAAQRPKKFLPEVSAPAYIYLSPEASVGPLLVDYLYFSRINLRQSTGLVASRILSLRLRLTANLSFLAENFLAYRDNALLVLLLFCRF